MNLHASDMLLRWASEVGSGSWGRLRDAAADLIHSHDLGRVKPWMMANDLSVLGHLDVDWEHGKWSVSPPVLALSPGMGLCGYMCGWRTDSLMRVFAEASDRNRLFAFEVRQRRGVTAWYVKAATITDLKNFADRLQIELVSNPAAQLAEAVTFKKAVTLATPVPPDEDVERFDPKTLVWNKADVRETDGLYSFEMHGQKRFRLRREGEWYRTDRSEGMVEVLQARTIFRLGRRSSDMMQPSSVAVPTSVSLPILAERSLVAASGLVPEVKGGRVVYPNVPKVTALTIAERLGCRVEDEAQK